MAKQEQVMKKRLRKRKVALVNSSTKVESDLKKAMDEAIGIMDQIEHQQNLLAKQQATVLTLMQEIGVSEFHSMLADAEFKHPVQKNTTTYDAKGLYEDVLEEDFVASVKVMKGLAEKVIDPKILAKHSDTSKSALKPKTLKLTKK